jgi:hypothetical protein
MNKPDVTMQPQPLKKKRATPKKKPNAPQKGLPAQQKASPAQQKDTVQQKDSGPTKKQRRPAPAKKTTQKKNKPAKTQNKSVVVEPTQSKELQAEEIEEELNQMILRGETPTDDDFRKFFVAIGFEDGVIPTPDENPSDFIVAKSNSSKKTAEDSIPLKIPAIEGQRCPKGRNRKGKWCVLKKPKTANKPAASPEEMVLPTSDVIEADKSKKPAKTAMNRFLDEKETVERLYPLEKHEYLYPDLNDPNFNIKIALKKEFQDAQYDGKIRDIEKQANILCKAKFELSPHQAFVKNFLSAQTPYKSLLLYHGLGTGKTCSAIGVAEEMRCYMKRTGLKQQIIVVASPNVQGNFRQQLFDERKLTKVTNVANPNEYTWNIESCVGNSLIHEINPNSIRNLSREKLISNINSLINEHYSFVGYIQFANIARAQMGSDADANAEVTEREIRRFFNDRLIIIDEVHNIRLADDSNKKEMQQVAAVLMTIVKHAKGLRLLLLSATPMFNSYKEIIWITNLLNANDGRSQIQVGDVFETDGSFRKSASKAEESGEELLRRKLTGYVSYVRGENPYTFPYRLYPSTFSPERALSATTYPKMQMNGVAIDTPIQNINVYVNRAAASSYQMRVYQAVVDYMRRKSYGFYTNAGIYREMPSFENMESFGYTILQRPLEALNIVYPDADLTHALSIEDADKRAQQYTDQLFQNATGGNGLSRVVSFDEMENGEPLKHNYEYKTAAAAARVFSQEELPNYSVKMAEITAAVKLSEGIVLIYSQYIDGGVVPMALALEEMGFTRYCHAMAGRHKHLFKQAAAPQIDAITMKPREEGAAFQPAQYIMITGDKGLSPSNTEDVKYATNADNMDGSKVKVIIISKAGSEGLDFKAIRQVHILEPWFNMNRIEQIIGRGVRNLSHCALPFAKRNVQIYLHATIIDGVEEEPADLYLYRLSERKAMQIGKVTRVLKDSAADCILHIGQTNFTAEKLSALAANQNIRLELSSKRAEDNGIVEIEYKIGDLDGSELCDYMSCEYQCKPQGKMEKTEMTSYTESNVESNMYYIIGRIKELYRERHAYTLDQICSAINVVRIYPIAQIYYVLSRFVDNRNMSLFDKYGRFGYLINRGKFYEFQPVEITDERTSIYERSVPVEYKRGNIVLELPTEFTNVGNAMIHLSNSSKQSSSKSSASAKTNTQTQTTAKTTAKTKTKAPAKTETIPKSRVGAPDSYREIIRDIRSKIAMIETEQNIKSTEMNWYKNASHALKHMEIVYGFTQSEFKKYTTFHYIDSANFETKRTLFESTFNKRGPDFTVDLEIETNVSEYFRNSVMRSTAVYIADKEQAKILLWDSEENRWKEGDKFDAEDFVEDVEKTYKVNKTKLNDIVGYMLQFKDQEMSFYYKDIHLARNKKGRKCDRSGGKAPIIKMLNSVTGTTRYNDANTSSAYMYSGTLCVILEMVLRHFHYGNGGARIFYLTPEQAIHNKITDYSIG